MRIPAIGRDPRSSGFPPNHPPMTSLLGVPISLGGRILGDLYLTDKLTADEFDDDDERLALLLARHAAVAIENAHLNDELERRLEQVSSLREFGQAVGQELDVERALQLVVERSADLLTRRSSPSRSRTRTPTSTHSRPQPDAVPGACSACECPAARAWSAR